jgi:hypothetical protein
VQLFHSIHHPRALRALRHLTKLTKCYTATTPLTPAQFDPAFVASSRSLSAVSDRFVASHANKPTKSATNPPKTRCRSKNANFAPKPHFFLTKQTHRDRQNKNRQANTPVLACRVSVANSSRSYCW